MRNYFHERRFAFYGWLLSVVADVLIVFVLSAMGIRMGLWGVLIGFSLSMIGLIGGSWYGWRYGHG